MADKTTISWTEATWNPIIGCARVSEGCRNCYAEVQAKRIALMHPGSAYEGVLRRGKAGELLPMWNGKVTLMPERLDQPIRWKRPRLIFVNSMSDLFHDDVPFEYVAAVFGVMGAARQHTFQVLTKRPARMLEFFAWLAASPIEDPASSEATRAIVRCAYHAAKLTNTYAPISMIPRPGAWPLPNVWLGVSCENQAAADERIPLLLRCPAVVRWVSAEPLLGPINFDARSMGCVGHLAETFGNPLLHWIVVGGESGPGARPCRVDWIRDIVDDCRAAGVAVYVKQVGAVAMERALIHGEDDHHWRTRHPKGGDPAEWPLALNVQEYPKTQ